MYELESDVVKVTDFGIARIPILQDQDRHGVGTPSYMSPEQLQGKKIDGRSDLFSLAVSLYQLSCGKVPFEGDSMAQLMYKIANEHASDILKYNSALPPGFVAFSTGRWPKRPRARAAKAARSSKRFPPV